METNRYSGCRPIVFLWSLLLIVFSPIMTAQQIGARAWLEQQTTFYVERLLDNISPRDGLPGAVIAAKSRSNPDYYYHWVRDAGIAIDALLQIYPLLDDAHKEIVRHKLFSYYQFTKKIQSAHPPGDLGEPKFHVDGSIFTDKWGRPQNDGPALRAISLIHFANLLLKEGQESFVKNALYQSSLPATSPIKMDLEYVSHHWRDPSYDLWEEVKGTHFYTLMVQRRALIEGAILAVRLGDSLAANWYRAQGNELNWNLTSFLIK